MISETKSRRSPLERTVLEEPISLTERDDQMLDALQSFGILTTLQLAMLFFPPDLERRLAWWNLNDEQIAKVRTQYSAGRLYERMELGKWLLGNVQKAGQAHQLDITWQRMIQMEHSLCLHELLQCDLPLPFPFVNRTQMPSDFISSACKQRLRYLFDAGYLDAEEQPTRLREGRKPTLWALSKKGAQHLAQLRGLSLRDIGWRSIRSYAPALQQHRLDNNDIRISFVLAAERHGWQIRRWVDDDELRRFHSQPSERVTWQRPKYNGQPAGEWVEEEGAMVADHYVWLDTGKNWHNFIECDRGTKTGQYAETDRNDFARKIRAFSAYYKSGRFAITYPEAGKSMRVLVITTSEARLQNLKSITENVVAQMSQNEREIESGLIRYWFTTFEHLRPTWYDWFSESTILDAPVWLRAGQTQLRPVIW